MRRSCSRYSAIAGLLPAFLLVTCLVSACGGGGGGDGGGSGGSAGVCGDIGSVPKLCNLEVRPDPAPRFGTIRVSVSISDREGDIDKACVGIAAIGFDPEIICDFVTPQGSTINERRTTDPIDLGALPRGVYGLAINVGDRAGNTSNTVTTTFNIQ